MTHALRWRQRRATNPFGTNVGVSRRLKVLETDPEDASLSHIDPATLDRNTDPKMQMEMLVEGTEKFQVRVRFVGLPDEEERKAY